MKMRGAPHIWRPPEEGPFFCGVVELTELARSRHALDSGPEWRLLHVLTPTSIRPKPRRHDVALPVPGAVLIPPFCEYEIDTRAAAGGGHHRLLRFLLGGGVTLPLAPVPRTPLVLFSDPGHHLAELLQRVVDTAQELGDVKAYWPVQHLGSQVLDLLQRARSIAPGRHEIIPSGATSADTLRMAGALGFIGSRLTSSFTIDELAREVGLSVSSLSRLYRRSTGETPMQTLRRLRIDRAKQLLSTPRKVAEIAEATGFCNLGHLERVFKQQTGMTPAEFRRRMPDAPVP